MEANMAKKIWTVTLADDLINSLRFDSANVLRRIIIISEVLSRLNINSLEELKTIEPEAYAFIVSLEHGSNELEVVP